MPALSLYFRPIEILFRETSRDENGATYQVTTKVHFFTDEPMTRFLYEKDFVFDSVPFNPTWEGTLGDIYTLITGTL